MSDDQISLTYVFSYEDYMAIVRAQRRHRIFYAITYWLSWLLIILCAALAIYFLYEYVVGDRHDYVWAIYFGIVGAIILFTKSHRFNRWSYKKQLLDGKEFTLSLGPEGVNVVTDTSQSVVKWDAIVSADEEKSHFVLWLNNILAYSVPKTALEDKEQERDLRNLLLENVANHTLSNAEAK